jgi:hypothetical protein
VREKNVFEASGNSPTATATVRVSESGALIQTGRGLEETKRRIMEAFQQIRRHPPMPPKPQLQPLPLAEAVYTDKQQASFHAHAERLVSVALSSAHIRKTVRGGASEIIVPTESAEELIAQAMRRFK